MVKIKFIKDYEPRGTNEKYVDGQEIEVNESSAYHFTSRGIAINVSGPEQDVEHAIDAQGSNYTEPKQDVDSPRRGRPRKE